jgi:two-component system cell cycle sensor histidine kinase/response regulator CckA
MNVFVGLLPYLGSIALNLLLALKAYHRRSVPGARPFVLYLLFQVIYAGGYIGELMATTLSAKVAWDSFQFLGAFGLCITMVCVARRFGGRPRLPRLVSWPLALALPLFVVAATLTEPWHGWFRSSARIEPDPPFGALWYDFVWIDYVAFAFIHLVVFYGLSVLLSLWLHGDRLIRRQVAALSFGILIPYAFGTFLAFGPSPFHQRDPAPFTFLVGSLLLAWAIFRARLFQLLPVARRMVVENMADGVLVADPQGQVVDANPAIARILGMSLGSLLGLTLSEALGRAGLRKPSESTGESSLQRLQRGDEERWYETSLRAIRDPTGTPQGGLVIFRDVTLAQRRQRDLELSNELLESRVAERTLAISQEVEQRRLAEQALAERERLFRGLFDQAVQLVGVLDLEGKLLDANRSALDLTDTVLDEVVGAPFWDAPFWKGVAGEPARLQEAIRRASAGTIVRYDVEIRGRDNAKHTIDFSLKAVRDEHGNPTALIAEGRDISELKRLERERLSLVEQLNQSQRLEAIGRLAGGIAHDFNNLLTVMTGSMSLLTSMPETNEEQRERAQETLDAAARAAELTRQLLTFSRRQVVEPRVIDPAARLSELQRLLPRVLGDDIVLRTRVIGFPGNIRMDPSQFDQVLMNLAVNARDAMPKGGHLDVELGRGDAERTSNSGEAGSVVLSVSDTGTGMAAEVLDHVFEPFFTTKREGKGTGLGLATVHAIVTQADGAIAVDSRPGQGTTFRICLPACREEVASTAAIPVSPRRARNARVLVVEDQDSVRELVAKVLRWREFEVVVFAAATEALSWSRGPEARFDIVLTDVVMPEMGGSALAAALWAERPNLPIVFMSGHADDLLFHHGVEQARRHFLPKPFTPDELVSKLNQVLENAQVRS